MYFFSAMYEHSYFLVVCKFSVISLALHKEMQFLYIMPIYKCLLIKSALHCFETVSQFIPGRRPSGSNISYKMAFYGHTIYGKNSAPSICRQNLSLPR